MIDPVDADRLKHVRRQPCIACQIDRIKQPFPTEAHHLVDKGNRRLSGGHQATIPLDAWHHRGLCLDGHTARDMLIKFGPSLALHKKAFIARYGTERELLALTPKMRSSSDDIF